MTKVVVALSGGYGQLKAAALLTMEQGYEVVGVTMRLWRPGCEEENRCCTPQTSELAAQLAKQLGTFCVLDAQKEFRQEVDSVLDGYSHGETPNPCVYCNRYLTGLLVAVCPVYLLARMP